MWGAVPEPWESVESYAVQGEAREDCRGPSRRLLMGGSGNRKSGEVR